jgi:hypothetical protein
MDMDRAVVKIAQDPATWGAVLMGILSQIAPVLPDLLAKLGLHAGTVQWVGGVFALIIAGLRVFSIKKEAAAVDPPPPTVT